MIGKPKNGIQLTITAFDQFLAGLALYLLVLLSLFAFSTMITWSYYVECVNIHVWQKAISLLKLFLMDSLF